MRERFGVGRKRAGILSAALAGSLLLLATPGTASAERDHRPQRHHQQHAQVYGHGSQDLHGRYACYCGICGHGFESHRRLQLHLRSRHYQPLALWKIPSALFHHSFGWGYGD